MRVGVVAGFVIAASAWGCSAPFRAMVVINSGGWQSPVNGFVTDDGDGRRLMTWAELDQLFPGWGEFSPQPLLERGYTVFEVRHGSSPRFVLPEIVSDLRRAVRFIRVHASEYQVDPFGVAMS